MWSTHRINFKREVHIIFRINTDFYQLWGHQFPITATIVYMPSNELFFKNLTTGTKNFSLIPNANLLYSKVIMQQKTNTIPLPTIRNSKTREYKMRTKLHILPMLKNTMILASFQVKGFQCKRNSKTINASDIMTIISFPLVSVWKERPIARQ